MILWTFGSFGTRGIIAYLKIEIRISLTLLNLLYTSLIVNIHVPYFIAISFSFISQWNSIMQSHMAHVAFL